MAKNILVGLMMLTSTALLSVSALADEPSLHQVYQAAEAGKLNEAQTMMHEVLAAHPQSGKAHFVEAELLAKQGQLQKAEAELATAERLAPGLPFAKPQALQELKRRLGSFPNARAAAGQPEQAALPANEPAAPWGMLFIGAGLIAFIVFAVRFMTQRSATPAAGELVPAGYRPGNAAPSYGTPMQPYGAGGVGPVGAPGPGLGSRVMSGLATGAAVGAGVVAGEALMHHFMDGKEEHARSLVKDSSPLPQEAAFDDMGGADFGIADTSSWDDGSGGGSDWN